MQRPAHHHPGNGFDPATPSTNAVFPIERGVLAESDPATSERGEDVGDDTIGVSDPGLSNKTEMSRTAGQPDKWPQRPDVPVEKSKTVGGGEMLLGGVPD